MMWNPFSLCAFGHEDRLRERNAEGHMELVCQRCNHRLAILPDQDFKVKKIKPLRAVKAKKRPTLVRVRAFERQG